MRDPACVGFMEENHMPTVGMVHAEKEGRTTGEKEAIPTLIEYPRMDMGRQRWCGSASCAREWGQAGHTSHHHLPRHLVSNYAHSFASGVGSLDRQSLPPNCAYWEKALSLLGDGQACLLLWAGSCPALEGNGCGECSWKTHEEHLWTP